MVRLPLTRTTRSRNVTFCYDYAICPISTRWRISTWAFRERIQLRRASLLRVHRDSSFSANDVSAQSSELDGSWRRDVINIARKRDSARPSSRNVLSLQCIGLTRLEEGGKKVSVKFLVYATISLTVFIILLHRREISTPRRKARLSRIEIASKAALWNVQLSNWNSRGEPARHFFLCNKLMHL